MTAGPAVSACPTRTFVKVCGITCMEDAVDAVACGADALGFIFVEGSPRYVGHRLDEVIHIVERLGPFVATVAVLADIADIRELPSGTFAAVQYYSSTVPSDLMPAWPRRILALRGAENVVALQELAGVSAVLVDAYHPGRLGGTGTVGDWEAARALKQRLPVPLILAGGLTPDNVGEAIHMVHPYAVDVSSGVEYSPGRKDRRKVERFIAAVREADTALLAPKEGALPL